MNLKWYHGVILETRGSEYLVHYYGWNNRFDLWLERKYIAGLYTYNREHIYQQGAIGAMPVTSRVLSRAPPTAAAAAPTATPVGPLGPPGPPHL